MVAADDGVMPQTREHLAVLELLEVPAGVVALTKADLVDAARREQAAAGVRELLSGGPYAEAPVVPVSTPRGDGLDDLRAALERVAAGAGPRLRADGAGRLHVDRCFTLRESAPS